MNVWLTFLLLITKTLLKCVKWIQLMPPEASSLACYVVLFGQHLHTKIWHLVTKLFKRHLQKIITIPYNIIFILEEKLFLDTALAIKAAPCWVINYRLLRKHQNSHIIIAKHINQCCKFRMIRQNFHYVRYNERKLFSTAKKHKFSCQSTNTSNDEYNLLLRNNGFLLCWKTTMPTHTLKNAAMTLIVINVQLRQWFTLPALL